MAASLLTLLETARPHAALIIGLTMAGYTVLGAGMAINHWLDLRGPVGGRG